MYLCLMHSGPLINECFNPNKTQIPASSHVSQSMWCPLDTWTLKVMCLFCIRWYSNSRHSSMDGGLFEGRETLEQLSPNEHYFGVAMYADSTSWVEYPYCYGADLPKREWWKILRCCWSRQEHPRPQFAVRQRLADYWQRCPRVHHLDSVQLCSYAMTLQRTIQIGISDALHKQVEKLLVGNNSEHRCIALRSTGYYLTPWRLPRTNQRRLELVYCGNSPRRIEMK